jgi:DeoR/GlpR family transcriptional regulator of sugar metabolism
MRNVPKNRVENILKLVKQNSKITVDEIANKLNVSSKTIKRDIAKLKEQNRL